MGGKIYNIIWRFCIAVSAILSLTAIVVAFFETPTTSASYRVLSTDINNRVSMDIGGCKQEDASKFFSHTTSKGHHVLTNLCFASHPFTTKDGEVSMLVPFKSNADNTYWWGNTPYSAEVASYTKKMSDSFRMTEFEEKIIENQYWAAKWQYIGGVLIIVLVVNVIFWTLFYVMAWVFTGKVRREK